MANKKPDTFQALIFELQTYWSRQGCVIMQPYDQEMGAGTFHPATTLRALGAGYRCVLHPSAMG